MAITINNNSPRAQYSASGGQTNFAGTWRIEAEADIKVYLTPVGNSPDDTTDILILTTDYTITGVGVGNSFTVILNSGATAGDIITILADIDFSANYNFLTNQNFDPDDFNEIFSKFDREIKQLRMETRKLQPKYQNSEQVIAKDYNLPQLAADQSWRMDDVNSEIEAVIIGDTGPGEQWYGVTSGVNTFLVTITDFIGYTTGETIYLQFGSSSTAASTININSLGVKNLLRNNGTAIQSGDLASGTTYVFLYHDGQYYLLGQQRATENSVGISQIATAADIQTGTDDFKYVTSKKLRQDHPGSVFYVSTSGTPNNYIGSVGGIGAYTPGLTVELAIHADNTGASTINLNGLGAKTLSRPDGTALQDNDLKAGYFYLFIFRGTNFRAFQVPGGSRTAWARFYQSGGDVITLDSQNINLPIFKNATGIYTVFFSPSFANANYIVTGSANAGATPLVVNFRVPTSISSSSAQITCTALNGALTDPTTDACVFFNGTV